MPDERAERLAEIVKSALELQAGSWQRFLDQECGSDPALRAEAEALLQEHDGASRFMEEPAMHLAAAGLVREGTCAPGQVLGDYEILSLIARGGMGEVYLAEDRKLGRKVALKLIRRGLDSADLIRHFQREERLLARLNHPNIAQLYGSGLTPDGIPFFAMEYVEGERLDAHCERRGLTIPERLELFRKICAAVIYAHQHLVIHRDLKPGNIRVTGDGEPKLLDFGIAKLLQAETSLGEEATLTIGQVMTPEYASPEQVRGETVATTTDVYSLGVVLYRLLTGRSPYRPKTTRADELARAITDQEPDRPSTVVGSDQKSEVSRRKSLRGDLDNIVLMAMRKEPARRYQSVAQFSEDIRRHLEGLPVSARKDTVGYRAGKFIKRHKVSVAAATLVVFSLAGGIVVATHEARRARKRFNDVRQLANSLMFEIHDSVQDLQGSTPTRQLIVERALQYLDSLYAEVGSDSSLERELATAYEKVGDIQGNPYGANLGDTTGALASYRKATALRERLQNEEPSTQASIDLARSYRGVGDVMLLKGDVAECLKNYRHSLALLQQEVAAHPANDEVRDELFRGYDTLGDGLARTNDDSARLRAYQEALKGRAELANASPKNAKLQRGLAVELMKVAGTSGTSQEEALANMKRAVSIFETLALSDPKNARARREVGFAYFQFGRILTDAHDDGAALPMRRKTLEIREKFAAEDPKNQQARLDLAAAHGDLAESLTNLKRAAEALPHARQVVDIMTELTAADPGNALYARNLALAEERLAAVSELVGRDDTQALSLRLENLHQAHTFYEKARDIFLGLQDRHALMPSDSGQVAKFNANLSALDQEIARLNH